jgi:hypothetical protein
MGGRGGDVALSLQALKRGAYRSSAHSEALGDFGFHDPRSRRELSPDDHAAQRIVEPARAFGRASTALSR